MLIKTRYVGECELFASTTSFYRHRGRYRVRHRSCHRRFDHHCRRSFRKCRRRLRSPFRII